MALCILFFGTSEFAAPSLARIVDEGHQVVRCVTQPDRPQGRGLRLLPSPVKLKAQALGVPVEEPETLPPMIATWQSLQPDLGVAIAYGKILPQAVLDVPRHGMLGVHPSMLPRYRGGNPLAWAILDGLDTTGVSIFRLNARMDAGDIALQRAAPIHPADTTETLSSRLADVGAQWLVEVIDQIARGTVAWQPQDEQQATIARKFTKDDGRIDWAAPAESIARLIRAASPWPGAYTTWHGELLKLWAGQATEGHDSRTGQVLHVTEERILISTGKGRLALTELQRAGGRRLGVRDFLRGQSFQPGELLGDNRDQVRGDR